MLLRDGRGERVPPALLAEQFLACHRVSLSLLVSRPLLLRLLSEPALMSATSCLCQGHTGFEHCFGFHQARQPTGGITQCCRGQG